MPQHLTPAQVRGARGMLDWTMVDLARAAGVSVSTVKRVEAGGPQSVSDDVLGAVRGALERSGVRFLDDAGEGAGMRFDRRA